MRQDLVDILKKYIYGLWGWGELGRGAQKVVAVSGEDKWLGAGWWPGHADQEETDSGVCPIKRPCDPSLQGGCELLKASTDRHAQHRAHAWPAPWGTTPAAQPSSGLREDMFEAPCSFSCGEALCSKSFRSVLEGPVPLRHDPENWPLSRDLRAVKWEQASGDSSLRGPASK